MTKTIKYQIDPNQTQRMLLGKYFGCSRFIYNYMLNKKLEAYKLDKTKLSYVALAKDLTILKKQQEYVWLNDAPMVCLQQSLRNMDSAFQKFFKFGVGFPKFKNKSSKQSCKFIGSVKIEDKRIKLPKIGWIRVFMDRELPQGTIGTVTLSKNSAGKYFVSIVIRNNEPLPTKAPIERSTSIGIDLGISWFATLSNGIKISNPKFLENMEQRLKVLQRRLSKKQKGSNRRASAKLKVAKLHYKVTCKRTDFLHKLSSKIVSENQTMVMEDLSIKNMVKNSKLAKSISSASWHEFVRQIKYKCDYQGKNFIQVGRFEPTSKLCSNCKTKLNELSLSTREWLCNNCGTIHDRDINAALNIKEIGIAGKAIAVVDMEMLPLGWSVKCQDFVNYTSCVN